MGQEAEAEERRKLFMPYQVNCRAVPACQVDALFMHCLPAHRGDEVTDDVIDSAHSVVYQQAENRLHAQKAILLELMQISRGAQNRCGTAGPGSKLRTS